MNDLMHLVDRPPWMAHANCRGINTALFFPEKGKTAGPDTAAARRCCQSCTVRVECLAYGLWERFGVWGGTTEQERRRLRRQSEGSVA